MGVTHAGRRLVGGTIRVFLAEALIVPTGLVTAAFLTRQLGPEGYGLFTLAATLVSWIEWSVTSVFARATVKFVGEADDWRPVGAIVMRLHVLAGVGAGVLLWFLAIPLAAMLHEPVLAFYLRLLIVDIPLFSLAQAHRNILMGLGAFTERALASAGRWLTRLVMIVVFVQLGFSVPGAILGSISASLVELAVCRFYVRPSLFSRSTFPSRQLWSYAAPLFLSALTMRLYERLDLIALKVLGGSAEQVGIYGAAQNLCVLPGIFALSFSLPLLSTLSRTIHADGDGEAKAIARNAMRAVIALLPFAAMTAGVAPEIAGFVFGPAFIQVAPLLAVLIFGALALVMISVATAILTAAGKPRWTFALTWPMLPVAIVGHLLLIPRLGPIGASAVTTLAGGLGALAAVLGVHRVWRVLPPAGTLARSLAICWLAFEMASRWPTPGVWLLVKLPVTAFAIALAFLLLGEFSAGERAVARSTLRWRTVFQHDPGEI